MAKGKKFYVVWVGRNPGVYDDWSDAEEQIRDFPGARYKGFSTSAEATIAFRKGSDTKSERLSLGEMLMKAGSAHNRGKANEGGVPLPRAGAPDYMTIPEIDLDGWAVDASCQGNPGIMEYRGVELMTGKEVFRVGPFKDATNNIGEFLAIVHALALMAKTGERHTIYSDSKTGMSWVKNRRIKTTLQQTSANARVFELMGRALVWLRTHDWNVPILKWQTEIWGEIPADFGRK